MLLILHLCLPLLLLSVLILLASVWTLHTVFDSLSKVV